MFVPSGCWNTVGARRRGFYKNSTRAGKTKHNTYSELQFVLTFVILRGGQLLNTQEGVNLYAGRVGVESDALLPQTQFMTSSR